MTMTYLTAIDQRDLTGLKDSPIKSVEDLKGKILADGGIGSGLEHPSARDAGQARASGQARQDDDHKKDGQNGDYYRAPDGKPDVAGIQASMEIQKQNGLLREDYLDLTLVKEASKRLK